MLRVFYVSFIVLLLSGCVSSLECGVKGDESYVSIVNVKDGPTVRNYGEVCGFAYEKE